MCISIIHSQSHDKKSSAEKRFCDMQRAYFAAPYLRMVKDMESVMILAEIDIVFLLVTIGLETSVSELIRLRKPVLLGAASRFF